MPVHEPDFLVLAARLQSELDVLRPRAAMLQSDLDTLELKLTKDLGIGIDLKFVNGAYVIANFKKEPKLETFG